MVALARNVESGCKFVLDQNLGHFKANLFNRAEIVVQAILQLECIFDLEMLVEWRNPNLAVARITLPAC